MGIAAESPKASACHIQCPSCSSGPCTFCLSPDSDFSSSFICLQLISVRSHPHSLLCSEMHMRGRLRHSSAHASPARGEWLTVRALPAILSAIRWCLIMALSLRTSSSECKAMLETVQQPKPLNTMQAACPWAVVDGAGVAPGSAPTLWPANPATSHHFLSAFKAGTLQPLPSKVTHSNTRSLWGFQHGHPCILSSLVWSLYQIAKFFGLILVFLGRFKDPALADRSQVCVCVGNS